MPALLVGTQRWGIESCFHETLLTFSMLLLIIQVLFESTRLEIQEDEDLYVQEVGQGG